MTPLRPIELGDAPAVFRAVDASRNELRRWMVWYRDDYTLADAEAWIRMGLGARERGTDFHFAIDAPDVGLVGVLGLEDLSPVTGRAMIGYWIATRATRRGIGTEAVRAALAWARGQPLIHIVWAVVAEGNVGSRRVLEANGFQLVGRRELDERGDVPLIYEIDLRHPLLVAPS